MNISNTTIHHHQNSASNASSLSNHHHTSSVTIQQGQHHHHHQQQPRPVNPNPSVHRFQTCENPWQLQSSQQQSQPGPIPPQRQNKKLAAGGPTLKTQHHISNTTYNQPVYLTSTAQTQTTPGLAPQSSLLHSQISPKSPSQSFPQPTTVTTGYNLMSTSLSGNSSSNMNHMPQLHHVANLSNNNNSNSNNNNNNNSNFDDLNLNGSSSNNTSSAASHLKKVEMKLNSMP